MNILPAIDIRDGKVVRLARGDYSQQTTYSDSPEQVARSLVEAGATWLHVVDLDAAKSGMPVNTDTVRAIRQSVDVQIEFGGGIRDETALSRMLEMGIQRVVIGSAAIKNWPWFASLMRSGKYAGQIALGLDAREGRLAAEGWTEQVDLTAEELARRTAGTSLGAIVYTDISRDGMLEGVDIDGLKRLIAATDVPVIASGGVRCLEDLQACAEAGCAGAIIGKAYYEGKIDIAAACRLGQED